MLWNENIWEAGGRAGYPPRRTWSSGEPGVQLKAAPQFRVCTMSQVVWPAVTELDTTSEGPEDVASTWDDLQKMTWEYDKYDVPYDEYEEMEFLDDLDCPSLINGNWCFSGLHEELMFYSVPDGVTIDYHDWREPASSSPDILVFRVATTAYFLYHDCNSAGSPSRLF